MQGRKMLPLSASLRTVARMSSGGVAPEADQRRPRGLAGAHLDQAIDALGAAGDPDRLYPRWARERAPTDDLPRAMAILDALARRHTHLRTAALFAALAAEAYVNEFLATLLSGGDFRAVDRLPTIEKYVVGCRLALGEPLFVRGREPVQTIAALLKLRDKLVHPKPGYGPTRPYIDKTPGETEADFTAARAGRFIVYVAAAAVILLKRARPEELIDIPATFIWQGRNTVFAHAMRVSGDLPPLDAPSEKPLLSQVIGALTERSEQQRRRRA
jgi:hypothetical protein